MDHKDWGSDDFLDDFLDFKYDNSAHRADRDHQEVKPAQKLPTEKKQETKQENKKYGLGEDSFREYERLRQATGEGAGRKADKKAEDLRASDAFKADILEPLSSRRDRKMPEPDNSQQVRKNVSFSNPIDEPMGSGDRILGSVPDESGAPEKARENSGKALLGALAGKIGSKKMLVGTGFPCQGRLIRGKVPESEGSAQTYPQMLISGKRFRLAGKFLMEFPQQNSKRRVRGTER